MMCECAPSYFNRNEKLYGGSSGYCICPAGQRYAGGDCQLCDVNWYQEAPNDSSSCTSCGVQNVTLTTGSTKASQCHTDPYVLVDQAKNQALVAKNGEIVAENKTVVAEDKAVVAENKAVMALRAQQQAMNQTLMEKIQKIEAQSQEADAQEEKREAEQRAFIISGCSLLVVVGLLIGGGLYTHRLLRRLNAVLNEQVADQAKEITYLRVTLYLMLVSASSACLYLFCLPLPPACLCHLCLSLPPACLYLLCLPLPPLLASTLLSPLWLHPLLRSPVAATSGAASSACVCLLCLPPLLLHPLAAPCGCTLCSILSICSFWFNLLCLPPLLVLPDLCLIVLISICLCFTLLYIVTLHCHSTLSRPRQFGCH